MNWQYQLKNEANIYHMYFNESLHKQRKYISRILFYIIITYNQLITRHCVVLASQSASNKKSIKCMTLLIIILPLKPRSSLRILFLQSTTFTSSTFVHIENTMTVESFSVALCTLLFQSYWSSMQHCNPVQPWHVLINKYILNIKASHPSWFFLVLTNHRFQHQKINV